MNMLLSRLLPPRTASAAGEKENTSSPGRCAFHKWCTRQDLNLHESLHTPLKRTCLPFHHWCVLCYYNRFIDFVKSYIIFFMKEFLRRSAAVLAVLSLTGCSVPEERPVQLNPSEYKPMETLDLHCDYVYLIDPDTGQTLIDRGSEDRMYPASLTKVMTSIIAIEEIPDPEHVTIEFTQEMLNGLIAASANRAGFLPGDSPTALDHIYGDLLPSGADCSRALAFYIAGDEEAFVGLMNDKAAELGMNDTHFVNTSGLHDDDHYTTCRDMMTLYLYCMKNETFMDILRTQVHTSVPVTHFPNGLGMTNFVLMYINQENPQYQDYQIPGFVAGKSGYTIEGQYTLVSNADINGMNLVMVNAHGYVEPHYPASIEDASVVYNWYREHFARQTPVEEGQSFGSVRVRNSFGNNIEAVAAEGFTADLPNDENLHLYIDLPETIQAPVAAGERIGSVTVYSYDRRLRTIDLLASDARPVSFFGRIQTGLYDYTGGRVWLGVILICLIAAAFFCLIVLLTLSYRQNRKKTRRHSSTNRTEHKN